MAVTGRQTQPATAPPATRSAHGSSAPQLAVWEYAGLMLTYWCNAKCAFCYVYSAPDRGGEMSTAGATRMWADLDRLAARNGKTMRIHLAGGEPFGDWPRLLAVIRAARDAGLTPLEKVETNAYWATNDAVTRNRLEQLDALGMEKLIVSADVYHQEFVPVDRVRRCVQWARRILGKARVRVRWWDFFNEPTDLRRMSAADKQREFKAALERHSDRLVGRAAERLGDLYELHPPEAFADQQCTKEVLHSKHVHIDGYGNVFPGVCAGIVLGNALRDGGVDAVWDDLSRNWRQREVVDAVVAGGSYELMRRAQDRFGYQPRAEGYANKCHLCTHVRQYLFERGLWRDELGPAECYANARDHREAGRARDLIRLTLGGEKLQRRTRPANL